MNLRRNWRQIALISVFVSTFLLIGLHLYHENLARLFAANQVQSGQDAENAPYRSVVDLDLGEVEVRGFNHMGSIRAYMQFSQDEKRLAIGTDSGEILMIETTSGKVLWREKVGIGKISALTFSADGQDLYVGETSPEGKIVCVAAKDGKLLWQYATVNEIGVDLRHGSLPGIVRIICDEENHIYFLSKRYENDQNGKISYHTRIYCFNRDGSAKWLSPTDRNMDAWVDWISVDHNAERLVFGTANVAGVHYEFGDSLYFVDAQTGNVLNTATIDGVIPYEKTALRGSPNISAEGNFVAAMASDGRAFLYDPQGKIIWHRTLSEPKKFGNVYLNAVGRDAYVVGDYVVFSTLNTYNSANWQLPTPVEHPSSNRLFVFDKSGDFRYQWQAGGAVEDVAFAYPYAAVAIGKNTKTKRTEVHGLRILNLESGEIEAVIPTAGPNISAAISPHHQYIAAIEVPIKKNDGTIVGSYQLHLLKNKG